MMSAGLASALSVFLVVLATTSTTSEAFQGDRDAASALVANGDNVARTLLSLDRLYTKRYNPNFLIAAS